MSVTNDDSAVRGTMEQRVAEITARLAGVTAGPWFVWDGNSYMGGGRDLCIGAGEGWMANMDLRNCANRVEHMEAYAGGCALEDDADICSLGADISVEQEANAQFIARAREDVPFLLSVIARLVKITDELQAENFKLQHPDA